MGSSIRRARALEAARRLDGVFHTCAAENIDMVEVPSAEDGGMCVMFVDGFTNEVLAVTGSVRVHDTPLVEAARTQGENVQEVTPIAT